jgi:Flp pilus assembly protein TadG
VAWSRQHGRGLVPRRARGERGTALIESALIFPVIVIILFGIVEVGYLFRSASLVTGSARAGARIASAQYGAAYNPTRSSAANAAAEKTVADGAASSVSAELLAMGVTDTPVSLWIYHADANGNTQAGNMTSCASECFVYTWDAPSKSWQYVSGGWAKPDACGQVIDYLGVYVVMNHKALVAPASLSVGSVSKKVVMRVEPRQGCITPEGPD